MVSLKRTNLVRKLNTFSLLSTPILFLYFNNVNLQDSNVIYKDGNVSFFNSRIFKTIVLTSSKQIIFNFGSFFVSRGIKLDNNVLNMYKNNVGLIALMWCNYIFSLSDLELLRSRIEPLTGKFFLSSLLFSLSNTYVFFFKFFQLFFFYFKQLKFSTI